MECKYYEHCPFKEDICQSRQPSVDCLVMFDTLTYESECEKAYFKMVYSNIYDSIYKE